MSEIMHFMPTYVVAEHVHLNAYWIRAQPSGWFLRLFPPDSLLASLGFTATQIFFGGFGRSPRHAQSNLIWNRYRNASIQSQTFSGKGWTRRRRDEECNRQECCGLPIWYTYLGRKVTNWGGGYHEKKWENMPPSLVVRCWVVVNSQVRLCFERRSGEQRETTCWARNMATACGNSSAPWVVTLTLVSSLWET